MRVCFAAEPQILRAVDGWLSGEEEPTDGIDTAAILRHCPGLTPAPNVPRENIQDGIVPAWTLTVTDADGNKYEIDRSDNGGYTIHRVN